MHIHHANFGGRAVHKRLLLALLIALSGLPWRGPNRSS